MKFGINQAISQTITQLSCIQLETHHPDFEIFDGSKLTQPLTAQVVDIYKARTGLFCTVNSLVIVKSLI